VLTLAVLDLTARNPLRSCAYSDASELSVSSEGVAATAVAVSTFLAFGVRENSRSGIFAALPFLSRM
jgi:hypothetical protein